MEQTKALNALAPFLALTKSATSPTAAANLIERATSAPNTFIFAELLDTPEIRSLAHSSNYSKYLRLLEIFSYGTYQTYCKTPSLPTLNSAQIVKLRQLSLLNLATNPANLSYDTLMYNLGLETQHELENLIISAIYAELIKATLDPYNRRVIVTSVSPLRDLEPDSKPVLLKILDEWSNRCVSTLADLERQITSIKAEALRRKKSEATLATEFNSLVDGVKVKDKEMNLSAVDMDAVEIRPSGKNPNIITESNKASGPSDKMNDHMDIDDEGGSITWNSSSSKKRGFGLG